MRDRSATTDGGERIEAGFYDDPVVYDILHTPGTAREVDGLTRIARRFVSAPSGAALRWLEPACGTGRYLRVAAKRGAQAIGFDESAAMVAYASERAPRNMHVYTAGMETFVGAGCEAGSIGFAFNLINTFRHLMDDAAAAAHLREMRAALCDGG
ncbi:MAG: class I SAM-dependent methyltransferase, partial [Planctomycetota bacterium]